MQAGHQRYRFRRDEDLYFFQDAVVNSEVQCRGQDYDCVQGEQYFATRNVYPADDVEVALNEAGVFAESTLRYRRFTGTLGLRYDYDDFLRNHDIAPRSRASLDVFGDGRTVLRAGLNRYYGAPLLTYRLREARAPISGSIAARPRMSSTTGRSTPDRGVSGTSSTISIRHTVTNA